MKRKWTEKDYFSYLKVPDTWDSVEAFADWYMEEKMPIRIPEDSYVYTNENATAVVLFRHKNFQVELYLGFPESEVDEHYHPGMEVIAMQIGKMNQEVVWGMYTDTLKQGQSHSFDFQGKKGSAFLTFEKWSDESRMTSASANWIGKTAGPKHDALIKKHYPDSLVKDGYAAVTEADKKANLS